MLGQESNIGAHVEYDSRWVRSALIQSDFLASGRSIDADMRSVMAFAIRWAPFGGASPGDLLVAFGVDRRRFLQLLEEALGIRRSDSSEQRWIKRRLSDALSSAWQVEGSFPTAAAR